MELYKMSKPEKEEKEGRGKEQMILIEISYKHGRYQSSYINNHFKCTWS